jgi:hypothetical protein
VIASDATVVTRPEVDDTGLDDGTPLVLAVDQPTALALADASVREELTILIA